MKKKNWVIGLFILAICMWFFPQWNGFFLPSSQITTGEGRIISVILLIGALFLWYSNKKSIKSECNLKKSDDEENQEEENNTLILQNDEDFYADIELYKNRIYYNSHPTDYLSDFNSIYEYKIEGSKVYQRLLEDKNEHAGFGEEYNVKDGIVLESEIIERYNKNKDSMLAIMGDSKEQIKKFKEKCEWNEIPFWQIKCFILSKHPEIVSETEFKKYVRSELERIKLCLFRVRELFNKYDVELKYDKEKSIYYWDYNDENKNNKKLSTELSQLWEQIKCERYEIECSKKTIETLNSYLNEKIK